MNFVSRRAEVVVVRQIPFVLLFVTVLFALPPLAFSLFHLVRGTSADGKYFCLVFGLLILWLMLEFVATRERFDIDLKSNLLTRVVSGVFRRQQQRLNLNEMTSIAIEMRPGSRGRLRQYLFMYGPRERVLLNSVGKVYIDHRKMGRTLSEITGIPYKSEI
jgi:hypothetical protein